MTTNNVVTEDLGCTTHETYDDDMELSFCTQGTVGIFDYDIACNQVLSQMVSIEIDPWWVLLDNCSTVNIFSNRKC